MTFSAVPASGGFQFLYGTVTSPTVAWNASNSDIATALENLTGISIVGVTGGLSTGVLNLVLGNSPALILNTTAVTLEDSGSHPITTVTSGELVKAAGVIQALTKLNVMNQLPLIAQNAFNLIPTIQTITFASTPSSGVFQVTLAVTSTPSLALTATANINYNDSLLDITNKINAILPSGYVTVTGAMPVLVLSFTNVNPNIITITGNTTTVATTITTNLAYGNQLVILGKYAGVTKYGQGPGGPITLSDSDFYKLILLAIIKNNFGSSLAQIQTLLWNFFQGQILVFDYANMQMSYLINTGFFSENLLNCFISQGLLPKPMGVQLASVIAAPNINSFFSFRTYLLPVVNGSGFNTYTSYSLTSPWVSYSDAVGA
jgi:hypothetical protein